MKFTPVEAIDGSMLIDIEPISDARGFFARTFCEKEFQEAGLDGHLSQASISFNPNRGTLRGLHYQKPPYEEAKLVRCLRGTIFDVIVDLRPSSPTFQRWTSAELSASNRRALWIPSGCAHGFITLDDDVEVSYQMNHPHVPGAGHGLRWNDPAFAIIWPGEPVVISDSDQTWPLWNGGSETA